MLDEVKETALRDTLMQYRSATKVIVGREVRRELLRHYLCLRF
jgi:hypothetical protein